MRSRWDSTRRRRSCVTRRRMASRSRVFASTTAVGTARWSPPTAAFWLFGWGCGLSNAHAAEVLAARGDHAYGSVDELWRRARVSPAALERLAEADAFQDLDLE